MNDPLWYVTETTCYPCAWKVVSDRYRSDNASCHFFETRGGAQSEAGRRNAHDRTLEPSQRFYPCCGAWWEDGCQCEVNPTDARATRIADRKMQEGWKG